jgi:hypothetical protein
VDAMGLPFLNAYLDLVGEPNFHHGCNFAAAGSTILPANAASISPFGFGVQVSQFLKFKARVLELLAAGIYNKMLIRIPKHYFSVKTKSACYLIHSCQIKFSK